MTEEILSLYITDSEAYLRGDRDYCLTVYSKGSFAESSVPEKWIYLGDTISPKSPTREQLLTKAVEMLDIEEQAALAEAEVKMSGIVNRRQNLLALPHIGGTDE